MNYLDFKKKLYKFSCFNINQIRAMQTDFDSNNLTRWVKKGLLTRLKRGYYSFPEHKDEPGILYYIANKIYTPSYVSLHTALSFYGLIPEAVIQITSVTSLKTVIYQNDFGEFTYKTVKKDLMFGYELKKQASGKAIKLATPEKALLDLFYLFPFYNTIKDMIALRFDDDYLHNNLDVEVMKLYYDRFKSNALGERVNIFFDAYEL